MLALRLLDLAEALVYRVEGPLNAYLYHLAQHGLEGVHLLLVHRGVSLRLTAPLQVPRRCCMNPIGGILVSSCFLVSCFFLSDTIRVCPDASFD